VYWSVNTGSYPYRLDLLLWLLLYTYWILYGVHQYFPITNTAVSAVYRRKDDVQSKVSLICNLKCLDGEACACVNEQPRTVPSWSSLMLERQSVAISRDFSLEFLLFCVLNNFSVEG
jgi:hypothetical protein